jgi:hypothetical protein
MSGRIFTREQAAELIWRMKAGESAVVVARDFGCCRETVRLYCYRAGITRLGLKRARRGGSATPKGSDATVVRQVVASNQRLIRRFA